VGRVYCGYFCFQTVWTDVFTWIEEKLEGSPPQRRKLDKAPVDASKIRIKVVKHALWLLIGFLTGFSFVAWFYGAGPLWRDFFVGSANVAVYASVACSRSAPTCLPAGCGSRSASGSAPTRVSKA
jgi:polyferredoxin